VIPAEAGSSLPIVVCRLLIADCRLSIEKVAGNSLRPPSAISNRQSTIGNPYRGMVWPPPT
jgi:hypothetical protein